MRGLHGLRGTVRVEVLTDAPEERFVSGARLFVEGTPRALTIAEASAVADGPGWWLRFDELTDRTAVEPLRDAYLEMASADVPREAGRWLWHELVGLAVRGLDGRELGTVQDIYRAGGAEVFVVRGPLGELDVPSVSGIVHEIAPDRGEIRVDADVLALDDEPVDGPEPPPRPRAPRRRPGSRGRARREGRPPEAT